MVEPVIPLPADHTFVLQLEERHGRRETCRAGRVEHLSSGKATRFTKTTEMWGFVDKVLAELAQKASA